MKPGGRHLLIITSIFVFELLSQLTYGFEAVSYFGILFFIVVLFCIRTISTSLLEFSIFSLTAAIPLSFINIFGGDYIGLPISFFNLFFALSIFIIILDLNLLNKISTSMTSKIVSISTLGMFFGLLGSLALTSEIIPWLGEASGYFVYFLLMLVAVIPENKSKKINTNKLLLIFGITGGATGTYIILQYILFYYGIEVGRVTINPVFFRISSVGLMADHSQASVYISSSAFILYFFLSKWDAEHATSKYPKIAYLFPLIAMLGSATTSARAGVISSLITIIFLLVFERSISKVSKLYLTAIAGLIAFFALTILLSVREFGDQYGMLSDPVRLRLISDWFYKIYEQGLFFSAFGGIGMGSEKAALYSGQVQFVPHFLLLEVLADGGIFFLLYFITIPIFLYFSCRHNVVFTSALVCAYTGAMFSPSMANSRFFPILLLTGILISKEGYLKKKSNLYK